MKLLFKILGTFFLCSILLNFIACKGDPGKDCFKTKQDSLDFANAVLKKYSIEKKSLFVVKFVESSALAPSEPVPWETINRYKESYDLKPIFKNPDSVAYKGFILNAKSFAAFKGNPNCYQLYLRFGLKDNGEYTVMVLPMDNAKNLLQTTALPADQDLNHDHLDPCPSECPKGGWN